MAFLPNTEPPGPRVVVRDGPIGPRGPKGDSGDPAELLSALTPGDALTVDEDGQPASLGPVVSGVVVGEDGEPTTGQVRIFVGPVQPDGWQDGDLWISTAAS